MTENFKKYGSLALILVGFVFVAVVVIPALIRACCWLLLQVFYHPLTVAALVLTLLLVAELVPKIKKHGRSV